MGIQDIDSKNLNEIMKILLNESEKNKINEFSKIVDILKETLPSDGVLEKKTHLNNNRQNLLIGEVEHIWREIDQNDNWELLYQKINNIRKLGYLLESEKLVYL